MHCTFADLGSNKVSSFFFFFLSDIVGVPAGSSIEHIHEIVTSRWRIAIVISGYCINLFLANVPDISKSSIFGVINIGPTQYNQ